jgi:hypothetical protein
MTCCINPSLKSALKATDFGAHSLRDGFLTSAARRGASVFKMCRGSQIDGRAAGLRV